MYGGKVEKNQIICVDSKVELFTNSIAKMTVEEIENYLDKLEETGHLDAFILPPRSMRILDKENTLRIFKKDF